jgi:isoleucyl-tRNA synthetase
MFHLFTSSTQDVEMTYYPKASAVPSGPGSSAGVSASVKFPEIEERILKYWDEDGTFQASIDQRSADLPGGAPGSNEFVF